MQDKKIVYKNFHSVSYVTGFTKFHNNCSFGCLFNYKFINFYILIYYIGIVDHQKYFEKYTDIMYISFLIFIVNENKQ